MYLKFKKPTGNLVDLIRRCGYSYKGRENNELNFIRRIGLVNYPHFHIYLKEENGFLILNLHLDQKKPGYQTSAAHSGDYKGEIVEREMERIKKLIGT